MLIGLNHLVDTDHDRQLLRWYQPYTRAPCDTTMPKIRHYHSNGERQGWRVEGRREHGSEIDGKQKEVGEGCVSEGAGRERWELRVMRYFLDVGDVVKKESNLSENFLESQRRDWNRRKQAYLG